MEYKVEFAESAEKDLFDIYYYIAVNDSFFASEKVVSKIRESCYKLSIMPFRGHKPDETEETDPDLLEVIHDVYRIIYEVEDRIVRILFIIDGRRDVQSVLRNSLND